MENKKVLLGLALTGMVMAAGCSTTNSTQASKVVGECHGVNSCKGSGACGGKGHSCAGKNSCKGKGWIKLTKAQCDDKGGDFKEGMM